VRIDAMTRARQAQLKSALKALEIVPDLVRTLMSG
jgi:hypothetical protein